MSLVWPDRGSIPRSTTLEYANLYTTDETTIYHTRGEYANLYITDAVFKQSSTMYITKREPRSCDHWKAAFFRLISYSLLECVTLFVHCHLIRLSLTEMLNKVFRLCLWLLYNALLCWLTGKWASMVETTIIHTNPHSLPIYRISLHW